MFVETYYDARSEFPAAIGKPTIPYPELVGEELLLWQKYLPVRTELKKVPFWLQDNMPQLVTKELEKAQKMPYLFERIEIWTRSGDPMAVGIAGGEQPRYFSITRWGDAKLTLEQVKKRLRMEEWLFRLVPVLGFVVVFLVATIALIVFSGNLVSGLIYITQLSPEPIDTGAVENREAAGDLPRNRNLFLFKIQVPS